MCGAWQPAAQSFFVRGMAGIGRWGNAVSRVVVLGDLAGTQQGIVQTTAATAYAETALNPHLHDDMTLQPYVGMRVGRYAQSGYGEGNGNMFDLVY